MTSTEVCAQIERSIFEVIAHDAAAVMTTDPETNLPAGGIVVGFDTSACVPFWDNELLDPDFNKFNELAGRVARVATLAEATDGDLARSPRYQKLYAPVGVVDELRVAFTSDAACLAIAAFVRRGGGPFSPAEVRVVGDLVAPAATALRHSLGRLHELSAQPPIVVILDGAGNVVSTSEGAAEVLDDLRSDPVDGVLPGTIMVAAVKARSLRSSTKVTTRLRGRSGRWVRVHVTPMDGADDHLAVTIDAARPVDLVPILLDSYGLTTRESEIVLAVCRGLGTKEIASRSMISVHTVRDHLKAIFEKSGVNSRGELVAKLFSNHLLGEFEKAVHRR